MHRKRTTENNNTPAWAERRREEEERRKSTAAAAPREGKKKTGGGGGGVARSRRYRAGVAPEWTKEEEEEEEEDDDDDDDDDDDSDDEKNGLELDAKKKKKKSEESTTDEEEESSSGEEEESNKSSSDSEDARDRTREMVKAKRLMNATKGVRRIEEEEKKTKEENEDEEEEEDDESDDDDDDASTTSSTSFSTSSTSGGGGPPKKMFKPVFVSKAKRDANAKAEAAARDMMMDGGDFDDQKNEEEEKMMMIKKQNAREAVQREITLEYQREVAEKDYAGEEVNTDSDDDDEEEARKNYEQWKMREFKRVVRDRCKQRLEMEEEEERERLRNMTEEERELYATKLKALKDAKEHGKEKSKMRFMQKYYHKGAFFQDAGDDEFATTEKAEIFNRDFNEATNAEKGVDRTTVPEAMRLRQGQFGKAGRSKWTHLSNEDTTFVNTEDARLRNAQQALMKQKKLEEQQPGADGGVEENKSGGNFRGAGVVLGSRLAADKNVEKILDAKRAGMKSSKTTNS